jgi:hypothetical protein
MLSQAISFLFIIIAPALSSSNTLLPLLMIPVKRHHPSPPIYVISTNDTTARTNSTNNSTSTEYSSLSTTTMNSSSTELSYSAIIFIIIPLVALVIALVNKSSKKISAEGVDSISTHELIDTNDMESSSHESDEFGNNIKLNKALFHKIGRRNSVDLKIIKKGISKALNGYSPSNDSEDTYSPFEHPSFSI